MLGLTTIHPTNKLYFLYCCTGLELCVMKTACMWSWCSWGTFSDRMVIMTDRFKISPTIWISVNRIISQTQSPSCPVLGLYSTTSAECRQHRVSGPASQENIYFPQAGQSQLRTKDSSCIQNPLWVWLVLHWADRPFRGHQVKGASTAHPNMSAMAEHSVNLGQNKNKKQTPWSESASELTDRATAACLRSDWQLLRIKGATSSAWRIPTAILSVF
jgi:hypothetical protein